MSSLSFRNVSKTYSGGANAVRDFNLDIDDKEFIVIVGPSGCGKSTVLRMIAGLEDITSGDIFIDGARVNDVEPKYRDIAMMFQNYTLFPHMTVRENMALGLKLRKADKTLIAQKVNAAAEALGIVELLDKRPKQLSGGQRQRVALGRAIVREPKVFLLDEPLSNLDAKLRVQMRTEIIKIHHRLKTTFVYVTHDQTEAMTMGTRIVVMNNGEIQQADTPTAIYENPANVFVACFLGSPQMNIFAAKLEENDGALYAKIGENAEIPVSAARAAITDKSFLGKDVLLGVRPENVRCEAGDDKRKISAVVDVVENLGNEKILYVNADGKDGYTVARVVDCEFVQGDKIDLEFDPEKIYMFDPETEKSIVSAE